jgi:hypothetical protein
MQSNRHFFWRGDSLLLLKLHVALFVDVDFGLSISGLIVFCMVLCLEIMLLQLSMHAAVTDFHRITIKYLMEATGGWEMFVN